MGLANMLNPYSAAMIISPPSPCLICQPRFQMLRTQYPSESCSELEQRTGDFTREANGFSCDPRNYKAAPGRRRMQIPFITAIVVLLGLHFVSVPIRAVPTPQDVPVDCSTCNTTEPSGGREGPDWL
ncbi:hypothetical protein BV25DRAFT_1826610 [Artomyces pyxidatus]|uniref:Uncharacterized protein n=1 Tax=Artomyces pyxidatus TaxID=48021 RepID=A0ACB8SY13_9AGAM|nr:hypothetical protein BV25DRAFT_1826610 [Artomyces pyxidatus]